MPLKWRVSRPPRIMVLFSFTKPPARRDHLRSRDAVYRKIFANLWHPRRRLPPTADSYADTGVRIGRAVWLDPPGLEDLCHENRPPVRPTKYRPRQGCTMRGTSLANSMRADSL